VLLSMLGEGHRRGEDALRGHLGKVQVRGPVR
jgi:hypothetical protein